MEATNKGETFRRRKDEGERQQNEVKVEEEGDGGEESRGGGVHGARLYSSDLLFAEAKVQENTEGDQGRGG